MSRIGIIGLGNSLRSDDGIGILLINELIKCKDIELSRDKFEFIDGGIGGVNLLHILSRFKKILIIDAVDFNGKPGDFKFFKSDDIVSKKKSISISTHESDFLNIIKLSEKLKEKPDEIYIFGIQPKNVTFGMEISNEIKIKLNGLLKKIKENIVFISKT